MIVSCLMVLMTLAAGFQSSYGRFVAALIFVGVTVFNDLAFSHLDGLVYYAGDAAACLLIIILTSGIKPLPAMVVDLQKICFVAILVNLFGWLTWLSYQPPAVYDAMFIAIYLVALITLTKGTGADVGWHTISRRLNDIRVYYPARNRVNPQSQSEGGT